MYDLNDLMYLYEYWINKRIYIDRNVKKGNSAYVDPETLVTMINEMIDLLQALSVYTYGYDLERRIFL